MASRLVPQKDIDFALIAFALANVEGMGLVIVGEGPLQQTLEDKARAGQVQVTSDLIAVLLSCGDHMARLVDLAASGGTQRTMLDVFSPAQLAALSGNQAPTSFLNIIHGMLYLISRMGRLGSGPIVFHAGQASFSALVRLATEKSVNGLGYIEASGAQFGHHAGVVTVNGAIHVSMVRCSII